MSIFSPILFYTLLYMIINLHIINIILKYIYGPHHKNKFMNINDHFNILESKYNILIYDNNCIERIIYSIIMLMTL